MLSQIYSINCWAHRTFVSPDLQWKIQWPVTTWTTAMQLFNLLRNQLCSEGTPACLAYNPALQQEEASVVQTRQGHKVRLSCLERKNK